MHPLQCQDLVAKTEVVHAAGAEVAEYAEPELTLTTTTRPARASSSASYFGASPPPDTYAPPANQTITGSPVAPLGAVTERTWQSSLIARPSTTGPVTQSNRDGSCGQTGPRVVVSSSTVQPRRDGLRRSEADRPCVANSTNMQQCAVILGQQRSRRRIQTSTLHPFTVMPVAPVKSVTWDRLSEVQDEIAVRCRRAQKHGAVGGLFKRGLGDSRSFLRSPG